MDSRHIELQVNAVESDGTLFFKDQQKLPLSGSKKTDEFI